MFSLVTMSTRRGSSRVLLYDGACFLLTVEIGDEESISEPLNWSPINSDEELIGPFQLDAREFLQPVSAQSMQTH